MEMVLATIMPTTVEDAAALSRTILGWCLGAFYVVMLAYCISVVWEVLRERRQRRKGEKFLKEQRLC